MSTPTPQEAGTIHFVLLGDERIASTRVRALRLVTALRRRAVVVSTSSLRCLLRSPWVYGRAPAPRVLVLQKVFPPRALTTLLRRRVEVLVLEIDDAIHLGYPGASRIDHRRLRRRVHHLASLADVITTPSPLLATDLHATKALVFPGPAPKWTGSIGDQGLIWLGSPSTEPNLALLAGNEETLGSWPGGAWAVGGGSLANSLGLTPLPWSEEVERQRLAQAATGLMPLARSPWNDRKAAYKVLEYLAAGVTPLASTGPALGALGDLGQFAQKIDSPSEWQEVLRDAARLAIRTDWAQVREGLAAISAERYADAWEDAVLGSR